MESVYPQSLQDVIALIRRLYEPGNPQELTAVQNVLQEVQRSPEGWRLADSLLESGEQNVQFFGALTFTVKLNSDWQSVPETDIAPLRDRLINWFVRIAVDQGPPLVMRKLCSTLVTFYIRFPHEWPLCIRHLLHCLHHKRAVGTFESLAAPSMPSEPPQSIPPPALHALLVFTSSLVEEVGKIDTKNIKNHHYLADMHTNVDDAVASIFYAIQGAGEVGKDLDTKTIDAGLRAFQSWVLFSIRASFDTDLQFTALRQLTPLLISWIPIEEHFETASEVTIEIMFQGYSFFRPEDGYALAQLLTSPWAMEQFNMLLSGESDWDAVQFGRLLIGFAEATVQKLVETMDTPSGRAMMEMLHGLLRVPGYPKVEDEVSGITFEFWGSMVDNLLDYQSRTLPPYEGWFTEAKKEVRRAVEAYWKKIRIPPAEKSSAWLKDQKEGFMGFRRDVADFVDSAYGLLGPGLFRELVEQVVNATASENGRASKDIMWDEVEASLFCLVALADSLGDEPEEDSFLESLFGSELFGVLAGSGDQVPHKARTTAVTVIGAFAQFFERQTTYLPSALNFLFTCLSTHSLAVNASKSISSLCSSCRTSLTDELPVFLHQYNLFANLPGVDETVQERILCAISYVIQSMRSEQEQLGPITSLLGSIEATAQRALALMANGRTIEAKDAALLTLRFLLFLGKGLQAPEDVPIDLSGDPAPYTASFWDVGEGHAVQGKILSLVDTLCFAFSSDGELIDTACGVFKAGLTENVPGLYCFPHNVITNFLIAHAWRTETILATAGTFVISYSTQEGFDIQPDILKLLQLVDGLINKLGDPQNDPEIAQAVVEFLWKVVRRFVDVLVLKQTRDQTERQFVFALESLSVRETLVKKAAASFWSQFLTLNSLEPGVKAAIDDIVTACGPKLAEKLIWALGGGCQRSEIDTITDPLRKLVTRHVKARSWLTAALEGDVIPSIKTVKLTDRRVFLEKVFGLRGKRGTNEVTKQFWLKCRGTEFDYVS